MNRAMIAKLGALMAGFAATLTLIANTETVDGVEWSYEVANDKVTIGVNCLPAISKDMTGDIAIPSTLGGYPVVRIGTGAFIGCRRLKSVTIPDGVESVGNCAFYGCRDLESVTIPDSVTNVGIMAFKDCSMLKSVNVSDCGKMSVCEDAFAGSGLKSITIPKGATKVEPMAFRNCIWLNSVRVLSGDTCVGKDAFVGCDNVVEVTVPGRKCGIPFDKVARLTILDGTERIDDSAFKHCSNIASVEIPASVKSISYSSFAGCSGVTNIILKSDYNYYDWLGSAFESCTNVVEVTVPGRKCGIPFDKVARLTILDGTESISRGAFRDSASLKSVTIPDSVTSIGEDAFRNCNAELFDTGRIPGVKLVDGWAVGYEKSIPGSLDLTGVRGVAEAAFAGCTNLTSVTIPASLARNGVRAFSGCCNIEEATLPGIRYGIPDSNRFKLNISEGTTNIVHEAFYCCSNLTSVTIPASVQSIWGSAFSECDALESFTVSSNNAKFSSIDGMLMSKDGKDLLRGVNRDVAIPQGVMSIRCNAFAVCTNLTSVVIPNGVTNIGESAFFACSNIKRLSIPASVTTVGEGAFAFCKGIEDLTVGDENGNFSSVDWLLSRDGKDLIFALNRDVPIPEGITKIYSSAFACCTKLTDVSIPNGATEIGGLAFYNCTNLTSVTIPESVTEIGHRAFLCCNSLTNVTFMGRGPSEVREMDCYPWGIKNSDCIRYVDLEK